MTTFSQTAEIVKADNGRYGLRAPKGGCTVDGKFYRGGSFCPPYQVDNPHELPVVDVKGASYLVQPMTPADGQVSAVRLIKRTTKEGHEVARLADGSVACTCPAFHYGNGSMCKHAVHAVANGLIPVAPVLEAPATAIERFTAGITTWEQLCDKGSPSYGDPLRPVTAGITTWEQLCDECIESEREEESSAPCQPDFVAEPMPAGSNPVEFADDEDAEPLAVADLSHPDLGWLARFTSVYVMDSVERLRSVPARRDCPYWSWFGMLAYGGREDVTRFLDLMAFRPELDDPYSRFVAFCNACVAGSPVTLREPWPDGPAPTWDAPRFEPTGDESTESFEDDPEYHAWLDRLAAERMEDAFAEDAREYHDAEMIRAVGCLEARMA